jgi:hypothetical protein
MVFSDENNWRSSKAINMPPDKDSLSTEIKNRAKHIFLQMGK